MCAERAVTNGNYICVFFMNPSNTGLLKMLPGYLRLSDPGDQIGMLLRQSEALTPCLPVMCLTACVEEYHVLFNYKCTLSTVVDMLEAERLEDQFELFSFFPLLPFLTITWCFNATCQLVYNHRLRDNTCFYA